MFFHRSAQSLPSLRLSLAAYAVAVVAFPGIVFLRFLLAPLTFVHPAVREWTLRRASALTLNRRYERRLTAADRNLPDPAVAWTGPCHMPDRACTEVSDAFP